MVAKRARARSSGIGLTVALALGLARPVAAGQPGVTPPPAPAPTPPADAAAPSTQPTLPLGPLPTGLVPPPTEPVAPPPPRPPPHFYFPPRPAAPTSPVDSSSLDLYARAVGGYETLSYSVPNLSATSVRGSGTMELTWFLTPVLDDETPRSLQPFLQHTSTVYGDFTVAGFSTTTTTSGFPGAGPRQLTFKRNDLNFDPDIGFDLYATDEIAFTAGFTYGYDAVSDSGFTTKTHSFNPRGGAALHIGDTRLDLSYSFIAFDADGTFAKPRWGTVALDLVTVFSRRVELRLGAQATDGGGGGSGSVEIYPNKNLGLFAGAFGYAGRHYNNDVSHNDYGGYGGVSVWVAPRARLIFEYEVTGTLVPQQPRENNGYSELQNELLASALFRLP